MRALLLTAALPAIVLLASCQATNRFYQTIHIPDPPSRLQMLTELREGATGADVRMRVGSPDDFSERLESGHRYTEWIYKTEGRIFRIELIDNIVQMISNESDPNYVAPLPAALESITAAMAAANGDQPPVVISPGASTLPGRSVIETRIAGQFSGWSGDTVFVLQNGQVWQQASYAYRYHYAYRPKVTIFRSGAGYLLHVDGIDETIPVRRMK